MGIAAGDGREQDVGELGQVAADGSLDQEGCSETHPLPRLWRRTPAPERATMPDDDDTDFMIPIGKADIKREGTDVTIVSYNKMMLPSMEAAKEYGVY